jgi:hypothetical protein
LVFCALAYGLVFGTDFKAAWVFRTVNPDVFTSFAHGLHALLWIWFVAIPHILLLPIVIWFWGAWPALLFTAFSAAVVSIYVAIGLRLIDQLPFTRQPEQVQNSIAIPILFGALLLVAIVVALQRFLLFREMTAVIAASTVLSVAAWFCTKLGVTAFVDKIRFRLNVDANESARFYTEIAEA